MKSILLLETIDSNDTQNFQLHNSGYYYYLPSLILPLLLEYNKLFKVTFGSSTDFYGRVTIYSLKIYGDVLEA